MQSSGLLNDTVASEKETKFYNMIYFLTAIGLSPAGSSTLYIYTQTIHRTTQSTQAVYRTTYLLTYLLHRAESFLRS
jgi:hypothetical protein